MKFLSKNYRKIFYSIATLIFVITAMLAYMNYASAKELLQKSSPEFQARLLYNFIDHIILPTDPTSETPKIKLCIMNDNPVTTKLTFLLNKEPKKNITILPKYENDYLEDCNFLFVNEYYDGYVDKLLLRIKNRSILTLGSISNFCKKGGMVQFILKNNNVEFIINSRELEKSGYSIDNDILAISEIIN